MPSFTLARRACALGLLATVAFGSIAPGAGTFALTMLASTKAGDAYSFSELEAMCKEAGFSAVSHKDLAPMQEALTIAVN